MHDILIRGGALVDGTGAPKRTADVAIRDGTIVEIGQISAPAHRIIDADGALVTPGFIDIHTHYDGQLSWDQELRPSVDHGITTAVTGNCGVGFAPVRREDRDTLIKLMEGVEDIPGGALHEGVQWNWQSFPEYLDALEAQRFTMDVACQVSHNPIRLFVMGDRAVAREAATESDIIAMATLVEEAMAAGAIGFSSADTANHRDADGRAAYARNAALSETAALARAAGRPGHGVIQMLCDFDDEDRTMC